ncbi:MAG: GntR family transcriptional regulator [Fuerstiella sp.]|nr:GntR family transcriptional regulator [Fuerstiella sp.]
MICHIETGNGIAIYEQIERQVKFAIANGSLVVGERIPSVRELATQTAVNVNTVARAYRELQQQGILNSIRGTGLTVSTEAPTTCARMRLDMIRDRLRSVLQEALSNRISVDEIRTLVDDEWEQLAQEANAAEHGE